MKYRLGDICTITKGETGIMKAIPGAYTMVTLGEANKTHNKFQFDTKAVIIPLVSSTGHGHASMKRVKYQEGKFALGNILCAVIPKNDNLLLAKYLHIYLHWNREELLVSQMKGMANVSLSLNKIADVEITVPSIKKQLDIIELEEKLIFNDKNLSKLFTEQLTQIESLNQAILQEAVKGKLVKQDPKDEPASELLERIKEEKVKSNRKEKALPSIKPEEIPFEIPENWVWCRLGELADIKRGKGPKYNENGVLKMLNQKCIRWYFIDLNYCKSIDEEWFKSISSDYVVKENDVLVNSTGDGTIGRSAIAHKEVEGHVFDSHILKVSSSINQLFICHFINSNYGQEQVESSKGAKSTKQHELGVNNLSNFVFPLPPRSEQNRIVNEIEKQFAKTKQLKEHIIANQQATEQLLKALLHQAFEVEEVTEAEEHNVKVLEFKTEVDYDKLTAGPMIEYSAATSSKLNNNLNDYDLELAMLVAQIEFNLGINNGEVAIQKSVYNASVISPSFSKQYHFVNSNYGTYAPELKEDLKANLYLIKKSIKGKEVFAINPEHKKKVLDEMTKESNSTFINSINKVLNLYKLPFINKGTDRIELLNTVIKLIEDLQTSGLEEIYQGMEKWSIKQDGYKTKADKFTKAETKQMIALIKSQGLIPKLIKSEKACN